MNADYLSDTHLDYWVDPELPEYAQEPKMRELIRDIIPSKPSKVLILAGDVGHCNYQNAMFLRLLREVYEIVLWTHGNHDLWLALGRKVQYQMDSFKRMAEMVSLSNEIDGVYHLDGKTMEIDGKVFGGFSSWYDGDFAIKFHNMSADQIDPFWKLYMGRADAHFINTGSITHPKFDWLAHARYQKESIEKHYKNCDVIFTHVSPDFMNMKEHWKKDVGSTFFFFNGLNILQGCKGKTWIFGHTHDRYDYMTESGCHMVCNPMGNKLGSLTVQDIGFTIRTVEV